MPAVKNTSSPQPYASLQLPGVHTGIVAVTGSLTVDLGIGHNNFVVEPTLKSTLVANANAASVISWDYGPRPGQFTLTCWKATAAGTTTLIAATAAVSVSFVAYADSSVGV